MTAFFISDEFEKYFAEYPFIMVDIGASGGIPDLWKALSKYMLVIGFEPDKREYVNLANRKGQKYKIKYLNTALADEKKPVKFFMYKQQQLSSIFCPNEPLLKKFSKAGWEVDKAVEVSADTMDSQFGENQIPYVDFIKIDAQGSELLILKGAEGMLNSSVSGVETEAEFTPLYIGQHLFSDIDIFLRGHNFHLIEIIRSKYWKRPVENRFVKSKGQIVYSDFLYLKDNDILFDAISRVPDEFSKKAKLLKSLVLSVLYGHADYGLEITAKAIESGWFDDREASLLKGYMNRKKKLRLDPYNKIPMFRGKKKLFNFLYFLSNFFKKKENRWVNGAVWK